MSISSAAEQASHRVREAASISRAGLLDFGTQALRLYNGWREAERRGVDAMLGRVGLQRKRSVVAPAAWLAVGAVVGGCVGIALSPVAARGVRAGFSRLRGAGGWIGRKGSAVATTLNHAGRGDAVESA